MKTHTTIGAKILSNSFSPILKSGKKFAMFNHEKWDGSGYPKGLKGGNIPIEGRFMIIVDQYDALRMRKLYKPPYTHEKAVEIIRKGYGRVEPTHFEPKILEAFMDLNQFCKEIYDDKNENGSYHISGK